jgi:hypothetical protein
MKKYKVPTKEDFYHQVITLNKTNQKLAEYYNVSESVIHTWKRYYKITKPIELVIKSYVHKGWEKGHPTWNKGLHKVLSEKCAQTYFTRERIMQNTKYYVPRQGKDQLVVADPTEPRLATRNTHNNKIYQIVRRIPYARYVLKKAGIEVPKGYIVYHIDGNMYNNEIGNLEVISRGKLMKRNHSASLSLKNKK